MFMLERGQADEIIAQPGSAQTDSFILRTGFSRRVYKLSPDSVPCAHCQHPSDFAV